MFLKRNHLFLGSIIGGLYVISRLVIIKNQPEFSVVVHNYRPYVDAWRTGFVPYLKQLYEYGPITIPLFYFPYLLERLLNVPYYYIYKIMLAVFDAILFLTLFISLKKNNKSTLTVSTSLIFFIIAGYQLRHFYFDSYDLVFGGVWFLSIFFFLYRKCNTKNWLSEIMFWLASGLKYINFPLWPHYLKIKFKNIRPKHVFISITSFLLVWLAPLLKFKTSLLTTVVLHGSRGLQVESFPANMARLFNVFTKTESFQVNHNAIEIIGPVSIQITNIWNYIFPISLGVVVLLSLRWVFRASKTNLSHQNIIWSLTLFYLLIFMSFGKILSTPYLIWPVIFLAVYKWQRLSIQFLFYIWYLLIITFSALPIVNLKIGLLDLHTIIGFTRGLSLMFMAFYFGWDLRNICQKK